MKLDPAKIKRKDGPSPWGSSYYGELDDCERKFFYRYVMGIVPKRTETADWAKWDPEALQQQLQQMKDAGALVPEGAEKPEYIELKPDALRIGTLFHLLCERWFRGEKELELAATGCPGGTTSEEYAEANRLFTAYIGGHGLIVKGNKLSPQHIKQWQVGGKNGRKVNPKAMYEISHNSGDLIFEVKSVEHTLAIVDVTDLHTYGFLLPLSIRYDTIVELIGTPGVVDSLEHKTTYRRINPSEKSMDLQIGMHLLVWNLLADELELPRMKAVILDQAVKGVKNPALIVPPREYFTRSEHQLQELAADLRQKQAKIIHLWAVGEKEGGKGGAADSPKAERLWERRRTACYKWNKACPYLDICSEGREAAGHLYELKPTHEPPPTTVKAK